MELLNVMSVINIALPLPLTKKILDNTCTAMRSNQSILKEMSPEYSLEGLTDAETETPMLWPPHAKN